MFCKSSKFGMLSTNLILQFDKVNIDIGSDSLVYLSLNHGGSFETILKQNFLTKN